MCFRLYNLQWIDRHHGASEDSIAQDEIKAFLIRRDEKILGALALMTGLDHRCRC